ncbi:MAG: 30S ribosome-binding factor RbfA [Chloroflexota bacterium]|nr:30S ribosome-binding factor RbfA [Chloroflexota bacterium]
MTERTARLDELLREEISAILTREVDDPRIGFVTITDVDVSPDLRHANVWVSVIGDDRTRRSQLHALAGALPFVRRQLRRLHLKRIPELHLKEDRTAQRGTRVLRILEDLEHGRDVAEQPTGELLPTPRGTAADEGEEAQ